MKDEQQSRNLQCQADLEAHRREYELQLRQMEFKHKDEKEQAGVRMQSQAKQIESLKAEIERLHSLLSEVACQPGRSDIAPPDRVRTAHAPRDDRTEKAHPPPNRLTLDFSGLPKPVHPPEAETGISGALSRTEMLFRTDGKGGGNWILPPLEEDRKKAERIVSSRRQKKISVE
jgi:hypothetical protein